MDEQIVNQLVRELMPYLVASVAIAMVVLVIRFVALPGIRATFRVSPRG